MNNIYSFDCKNHLGESVSLSDYQGQVLLIVNTASKCGYTPQYEGLNELHEKYHGKDFSVLGFPCNQFGGQEPGSNEEIQSFNPVSEADSILGEYAPVKTADGAVWLDEKKLGNYDFYQLSL